MIVYKATSKTTHKVYIGITTNSLQHRMDQHKKAAEEGKPYHFYCAIRKYGFDDFNFEIIEDGITDIEKLKEREQYWIQYYNSYEDGYNSTRGGEGVITRDDEWILKLFMEGKSVKEIQDITGYERSTIYRSFKAQDLSEENRTRNNLKVQQRCSMAVLQYDLDGNLIREWPSATSVQEEGYSQAMVSKVCRQEQITAHDFLWKYKEDPRPIEEWVQLNKNRKQGGRPKKPIYQLNDNHEIIAEYESGAAAAKAMGLTDKSNICAAARKNRKCCGYYWQYKS